MGNAPQPRPKNAYAAPLGGRNATERVALPPGLQNLADSPEGVESRPRSVTRMAVGLLHVLYRKGAWAVQADREGGNGTPSYG